MIYFDSPIIVDAPLQFTTLYFLIDSTVSECSFTLQEHTTTGASVGKVIANLTLYLLFLTRLLRLEDAKQENQNRPVITLFCTI